MRWKKSVLLMISTVMSKKTPATILSFYLCVVFTNIYKQ